MRRIAVLAALGAISALGAAAPSGRVDAPGGAGPVWVPMLTSEASVAAAFCSAESASPTAVAPAEPAPTEYYTVDLVTTKKIPGTARAYGHGRVDFAPSPFGVALAADGSYVYDLSLQLREMDRPSQGTLVAWVTTPQVDRIRRLGTLDDDLSVRGQVSWNKFLVVVTLEGADDASATTWSGPIVLRGMSRSGAMHTMAGHGPFQQELCAKYGYR